MATPTSAPKYKAALADGSKRPGRTRRLRDGQAANRPDRDAHPLGIQRHADDHQQRRHRRDDQRRDGHQHHRRRRATRPMASSSSPARRYSGAFSVVDGVATLPDYSTGTISFTFIPDDSAAANGPTQYHDRRHHRLHRPGRRGRHDSGLPVHDHRRSAGRAAAQLLPAADVIGEIPSRPKSSPASRPSLGLLVTNVGGGTANNLSITTAQPQIVQNAKGLLDTFQIIGTQVGNQQETPSLTVDFGDIAPGQTADATFLLASSLQGVFDDFTATFSHSDALGGTETSLISSVTTHTLIHAGDFNYPDSTGAIDYLADDTPNPENLPDTIYFSDGTTAPVNIATDADRPPRSVPSGDTDLPGHRQRHERLGLHPTPRSRRRLHALQGRPLGRHRHSGQRPGLDRPTSRSRRRASRRSITSCTSSTTTAPARTSSTTGPTTSTPPAVASLSIGLQPAERPGRFGRRHVLGTDRPLHLHDGEPESHAQRRAQPDQLVRDDHPGFADDLHDRRPLGPHRRRRQLHADRQRRRHQRLLRRRRHRARQSTSWATGHRRAGGRERRSGQSDPPEYACGYRRRRPLRADRPGVVRLPGAEPDPERRAEPHHLRRDRHRDRPRRPTRSAASAP